MAKLGVYNGTTNLIVRVRIRDTSVTTKWQGRTGLTASTPSLACCYIREGSNAVTDLSLASTTVGAYLSGGFVEVNSTKFAGLYELGIPVGAIQSGSRSVAFNLYGASNMEDYSFELDLEALNRLDGTNAGLSGISSLATSVSNVPGLVWTNSSRTLTDKLGFALSGSGLDAITIDGINLRQALHPIAGMLGGVISGAGPGGGIISVYGINQGTSQKRLDITADDYGNRSSVTLTLPS